MANEKGNNDVAAYYDIIYQDYFENDLTEKEVQLIELHAPADSEILDLGCGDGRHLIPLAQQGYHVYGIDTSEQMVNRLKAKLPNADVHVMDIYRDTLPQTFDLVMIMWNAICEIAMTQDDLETLFGKLTSVLNPGGSILIDMLYDESKPITYGLDLTTVKEVGNITYTDAWTILKADEATNTTVCEERITVENTATGEVVDEIVAENTQRWWTRKDFENVSHAYDLAFNREEIVGSEHSYYFFTKMR